MNNNTTTIDWKTAWEYLKKGNKLDSFEIAYTDEKIPWQVVMDFNEAGLRVPKHLIDYDDANIDYSDNPPLEELLLNDSFNEIIMVTLEPEVAKWVKESHIDYNLLINNFMRVLYSSAKSVK